MSLTVPTRCDIQGPLGPLLHFDLAGNPGTKRRVGGWPARCFLHVATFAKDKARL